MGSCQPADEHYDLKLAWWADIDSDDAAPDMSEELPASRESRKRAALSAGGWTEGPDML